MLKDFRQTDCGRIIAIGGGAVIDMAKILVLDGEAKASEYYQKQVPVKKVRTLVAVPPPAGRIRGVQCVDRRADTAADQARPCL